MNCTSALPADAALNTLLLPFATGALIWPSTADVLFMRARAGAALGSIATDRLVCQQSFKPFADALLEMGLTVAEPDEQKCPLGLLLPPRQREESRALLARALQRVEPGGTVVASALNNEGARSAEGDLERLAGSVRSLSKNKCRVFWATATAQAMNTDLITAWATLDAPQRIADGRFLSRPGLFSWTRIDRASALLARCLPANLAGCGADLGAGFGYLAAEVLARCPGVSALDLYEAEARGLDLTRSNLKGDAQRNERAPVALSFFWHDVTSGLDKPQHYDFIVSNPPFHQGRADQPEIGCAFIIAAAAALRSGGCLWLVANRHLPYEQVLRANFRKVRTVAEEHGFKVIEAIKGR